MIVQEPDCHRGSVRKRNMHDSGLVESSAESRNLKASQQCLSFGSGILRFSGMKTIRKTEKIYRDTRKRETEEMRK